MRLTRLDGVLGIRKLAMVSLTTDTLFHRIGSGHNRTFRAVRRAELLPLKVTTPAIEQMIAEGALFKD